MPATSCRPKGSRRKVERNSGVRRPFRATGGGKTLNVAKTASDRGTSVPIMAIRQLVTAIRSAGGRACLAGADRPPVPTVAPAGDSRGSHRASMVAWCLLCIRSPFQLPIGSQDGRSAGRAVGCRFSGATLARCIDCTRAASPTTRNHRPAVVCSSVASLPSVPSESLL
jgi:hypothetical protein